MVSTLITSPQYLNRRIIFSDVDNKKADLAIYIQEYLCLLLDNNLVNFVDAIDKGEIKECGVDGRHIKIVTIIFGPARATMERFFKERTRYQGIVV